MQHRNAPAVQYPVGRSRMEGLVLLLAAAAGTLAALAWAWQLDSFPNGKMGWDARPWLMLALLWALVLPAAWVWWRTPPSQLAWDGVAWSWSGCAHEAVHEVQLAADLQGTLLLRLVDARGHTLAWLWAQSGGAPALWKPLRRALVAARWQPQPSGQAAAGDKPA